MLGDGRPSEGEATRQLLHSAGPLAQHGEDLAAHGVRESAENVGDHAEDITSEISDAHQEVPTGVRPTLLITRHARLWRVVMPTPAGTDAADQQDRARHPASSLLSPVPALGRTSDPHRAGRCSGPRRPYRSRSSQAAGLSSGTAGDVQIRATVRGDDPPRGGVTGAAAPASSGRRPPGFRPLRGIRWPTLTHPPVTTPCARDEERVRAVAHPRLPRPGRCGARSSSRGSLAGVAAVVIGGAVTARCWLRRHQPAPRSRGQGDRTGSLIGGSARFGASLSRSRSWLVRFSAHG